MTTTTESVHATKLSKKGRKAIVAGSIGNAVEFVDWAIYSTFSSIFAHHFFPPGNDVAALLSTLAILGRLRPALRIAESSRTARPRTRVRLPTLLLLLHPLPHLLHPLDLLIEVLFLVRGR